MSKLVRITAPHAFVNNALAYEGDVVSVPDDTSGDWFEDAGELALVGAAEKQPPEKVEPMAFSEHRRSEAATDFIGGMKKIFKRR